MRFLIINGSLTPPQESNTQRVIDRVRKAFKQQGSITDEIILRDLEFEPGIDRLTRSQEPDDMTEVLAQILNYDGLIIATPIWWGTYSSYTQAFLERLGWYDDWSIKHNIQPLYGKTFGTVISGGDDGWQHVYGQLFHTASYLGFTIPPDAFIAAVGNGTEDQGEQDTDELIRIFARNQIAWATALKQTNVGLLSQTKGGRRTGYVSAGSFRKGMITRRKN